VCGESCMHGLAGGVGKPAERQGARLLPNWEYPHNCHIPTGCTPCFIDEDGRQCAVAYLMHASGATEAALGIARAAN